MFTVMLLVQAAAQFVGTVVVTTPREEFVLQQPGRSFTAKVDGRGLTGPAVQLERTADGLRGSIGQQPADLQFTADRVTGLVGRLPVNLKLARTEDGMRLSGLWAGRLSNLRVSPYAIDGSLGRCGYTLHAEGNRYQGERSCGGLPAPVVVQIPASLTQRPMGEFAASIVALLAQANPQ